MAGERYTVPEAAPRDVSELHRWVLDLVQQLNGVAQGRSPDNAIVATIGTSETTVRHGGRSVPRNVRVEPRADARVWRSRAPDATNVYYRASASVECEIRVEF